MQSRARVGEVRVGHRPTEGAIVPAWPPPRLAASEIRRRYPAFPPPNTTPPSSLRLPHTQDEPLAGRASPPLQPIILHHGSHTARRPRSESPTYPPQRPLTRPAARARARTHPRTHGHTHTRTRTQIWEGIGAYLQRMEPSDLRQARGKGGGGEDCLTLCRWLPCRVLTRLVRPVP